MIAKVAPLRRMPRSTEPYDYIIPEDLTVNVGSFVEVPMRGKLITGIVIEIVESSKFKKLLVISKILKTPQLSNKDVEFYANLARRTYQSVASILQASIPGALKRKTTISTTKIVYEPIRIHQSHVGNLKKLVHEFSIKSEIRASVPSDGFSIAVVIGLLKTTTNPLLVICPDLNMVNAVISSCTNIVNGDITVYGGNMNKTQAYNGWLRIREGSKRLTVTTRIGALVPPSMNTKIIVLACGESDHFQTDQNPHYDVRWCVKEIARLNNNGTMYLGTMPRVEDGELYNDLWEYPKLKIINIEETKRSSDSYWLSPPTIKLVQNTDTSTAPLILYFNRKYCEQNYTSNVDIAHEIKLLVSNKGNIPAHKNKRVQVIESEDELPNSGIAIVTSTVFYKMKFSGHPISGLVILNAEQPFVMRGFRSLEKAVRVLRRLSSWAYSVNAPIIIQTKNPKVVSEALGSTFDIFKKELSMRSILKYPPFGDVHILYSKEQLEIIDSYKAQHKNALGKDSEIIVKTESNKIVNEWISYPQSCDIIVNPDNVS